MASSSLFAAETAHTDGSASPAVRRDYFFVTGETRADLLARVLGPFLKTGLSPYRIHASSEHGSGDETQIELRMAGLRPGEAELLAASCRAIVGVQTVLTVSDA